MRPSNSNRPHGKLRPLIKEDGIIHIRSVARVMAVLCTLFLMAGLIWMTREYNIPTPLNNARIVERQQALLFMNAANQQALNNYEWADSTKGIVRIPIQRAMELTAKYWQDPMVGRSNLLSHIE